MNDESGEKGEDQMKIKMKIRRELSHPPALFFFFVFFSEKSWFSVFKKCIEVFWWCFLRLLSFHLFLSHPILLSPPLFQLFCHYLLWNPGGRYSIVTLKAAIWTCIGICTHLHTHTCTHKHTLHITQSNIQKRRSCMQSITNTDTCSSIKTKTIRIMIIGPATWPKEVEIQTNISS